MLNDFISQIKAGGLSRTNRYKVTFSPPTAVSASNLQNILLFCDQAQLPGINYSTTQNRSFGEFREIPYEKLFDPCQLSFYVDTQLSVKVFFDKWLASIQSPETRSFNYYSNYTTDMEIEVQDINDKTRYTVKLFECYPKTVSSVQLDYSAKDIMKLNVSIQYKYWKSSAIEQIPSGEVITTDNVYSPVPIAIPNANAIPNPTTRTAVVSGLNSVPDGDFKNQLASMIKR